MKGVLSLHLLRLGVLCGVWVCVGVCPQEGLGAGTRLGRDWEDSPGLLSGPESDALVPGPGRCSPAPAPSPPPLLVPSYSPPNPGRGLPQPPLSGAQPLSQTRCKHCTRWLQGLPGSSTRRPQRKRKPVCPAPSFQEACADRPPLLEIKPPLVLPNK